MAGFLDDFYTDTEVASRRDRVADDPGLTDDARMNALLGAIGEHLMIRWNLGDAPPWSNRPERFLDRPWFMGPERMKGFLLACKDRASERHLPTSPGGSQSLWKNNRPAHGRQDQPRYPGLDASAIDARAPDCTSGTRIGATRRRNPG